MSDVSNEGRASVFRVLIWPCYAQGNKSQGFIKDDKFLLSAERLLASETRLSVRLGCDKQPDVALLLV